MALYDYVWLIPALPALAFVAIAAFGKKTPEKGGYVALALVGLAGLLAVGVFLTALGADAGETGSYAEPYVAEVPWWSIGPVDESGRLVSGFLLTLGVYVDPLTAFMLFIVGILVTLIVLYSIGYMHGEEEARRRYYAELTLFICGMLGLVVANNYLMLFVFWEIMGLCSYLLIGYWFTKPSAAAAAKKAFLVTRIGDVFLFTGIILLLYNFADPSEGVGGVVHSLDYKVLFDQANFTGADLGVLALANACIFIGAVGKSALFPLHVWLPDAMEGPTTVSALIHAATMVKAGVYLLARSYPLFVLTPEVLVWVAVIGGFTALFAASMALVNNDLKRVLAYSTLSQLGYMYLGLGVAGALVTAGTLTGADRAQVLAVALAGVTVAIFHLFAHAFFKAGLFLSAGSVGHATHTYDMRHLGGLWKAMPITGFAMLMGTLSIAGVPPFSGFYSKDALLELVYEAWHGTHGTTWLVLYAMGVATAFMTAYYMFRLFFMTFTGRYRGAPAGDGHGHAPGGHGEAHLHESPPSMTVPLVILSAFALLGGVLVFGLFGGSVANYVHADPSTLANAKAGGFAPHAVHGAVAALVEPFKHTTTYVSILAALGGIGVAWSLWRPDRVESSLKSDEAIRGFGKVLYNRYYVDHAYNWLAGKVVVGLAFVINWFDQFVIDGVVNGIADLNQRGGERARKWNTGNVQDYALTLVAGFVVLVILMIYVPIFLLPRVKGYLGLIFPGGL